MTDRISPPLIDDVQAARIDQRLEQFGSFMQSVFRHPEIAEEIPTGSTLAFHDVALLIAEHPVRLTAFRPRRSKRWGVRVTGFGDDDGAVLPLAEQRYLWSIAPLVKHATWGSAAEAFAAVEDALLRARVALKIAG